MDRMGQSASASLIFGVFLGDTDNEQLPSWIRSEEDPWSSDFSENAEEILRKHGVEDFRHGYDFASRSIGVRLAWAVGYGEEVVDLEMAHAKAEAVRPRLQAVLNELNAPEDVKLQVWLLVAFS